MEDKQLRDMLNAGTKAPEIAQKLRRTIGAIYVRKQHLDKIRAKLPSSAKAWNAFEPGLFQPCLRVKKRKIRVAAGKLKTWNADRGFGFIAVDGGGQDMFLHVSDLRAAGIDPESIKIGDRLTFETASTRDGKTKASNVRRI
jgi:cold shock protein